MSWKEFFLQILDWCGQQATLIVAIVGFITSLIIARLNSRLALENDLFKKWVEVHEKSIRQLWKTIETYDACIKGLKLVANGQAVEMQRAFLVASLQQLIGIEKDDDDLFGAILFSTDGLTYDNRELLSKMIRLSAKMNGCAAHTKAEDGYTLDCNDEIQQFAITMEQRQKFLIHIYNLWSQRFQQHPRVKKWIDKGV